MAKRLEHQKVSGPHGEVLKISWMPEKRVRIDFENCGAVVVTKIFPSPIVTHVELSYSTEKAA